MSKELKKFEIDNSWRESGALIEIAHPDDELLIAWGAMHCLLEAGIPITVLTLTLGELGETKDKPALFPPEMARIREKEFRSSSLALGLRGFAMNYPDTGLSRLDLMQKAKHDTLEFIREHKFGVIFSFHPFEITPEFDHPDHNAVGEIVRYADTVSAVRNLHTIAEPLNHRPSLYFWTTNPVFATHQILFTPEMENGRKNHLADYYPSQFPRNSMNKWGVIFDDISRGMSRDQTAQEMFIKIR